MEILDEFFQRVWRPLREHEDRTVCLVAHVSGETKLGRRILRVDAIRDSLHVTRDDSAKFDHPQQYTLPK